MGNQAASESDAHMITVNISLPRSLFESSGYGNTRQITINLTIPDSEPDDVADAHKHSIEQVLAVHQ